MFFQRIGASGYVLGRLATEPSPRPLGVWLRYAAVIENLREAIDQRMRTVLTGERGAIASALITGKRGTISQPVNDSPAHALLSSSAAARRRAHVKPR
jgi:competence protein ComEC